MSLRFHAALFAIFNETFCYTMHEWLVNKYVSLVGNEVEITRHSHVPTNIFQEWQFFIRLILIITFYAYLHSILLRHFFMFLQAKLAPKSLQQIFEVQQCFSILAYR